MKLKSFRYLLPQAFRSLFANGWMTIAAIITITISLLLCTFFWLLVINIDANASDIESNVKIVAYIKDEVPEDQFDQMKTMIHGLDGTAEVTFVSKQEGIKELSQRFNGVDLESTLDGVNPLPNSFNISAASPDKVATLAATIEKIEGIEKVRYGEDSVEKLFAFTSALRKAGIGIMILLGFAAIVLVAMSIRLTVYARSKEIMVMKWVGATDSFIRWPFFLEGMLLGLVGSVLALAIVFGLYYYAIDYVSATLSFVYIIDIGSIWLNVVGFTILAGILLGAFGSIISVAKFLDV